LSSLQTEFPFRLARGYIDAQGERHVEGTMRLATAADELLPMRDPRVHQNDAYAAVIILARVVTRLGSLDMISTQVIENLFASDFAQLSEMYDRINAPDQVLGPDTCPNCGASMAAQATTGEDAR